MPVEGHHDDSPTSAGGRRGRTAGQIDSPKLVTVSWAVAKKCVGIGSDVDSILFHERGQRNRRAACPSVVNFAVTDGKGIEEPPGVPDEESFVLGIENGGCKEGSTSLKLPPYESHFRVQSV